MADRNEESLKERQILPITVNGKRKFECKLCHRHLSTKYSLSCHLNSAHGMSPVKRTKKKYVDDPNVQVPRSTLYYQRRKLIPSSASDDFLDQPDTENDTSKDLGQQPHHVQERCVLSDDTGMVDYATADDLARQTDIADDLARQTDTVDDLARQTDIADDLARQTDTADDLARQTDIADDLARQTDESDCHSIGINYSSDNFSTSDAYSDLESSCYSSDHENTVVPPKSDADEKDHKEMSILSCFLRNNLSASSCKDILTTMQTAFRDCLSLQEIDYDTLWKHIDSDYAIEIHYCENCCKLFPDNADVNNCENCNGLRYKGLTQMNGLRQPRASFVLANLKRQLKNLLQSPGIWEDIKKNKKLTNIRHLEQPDILTDITDGIVYKHLTGVGEFLEELSTSTNLTAIINTDGLCLYASSKVQLWPIFLAINELTPCTRFARENMILAGIWQGKGKPPFEQYFQSFSSLMNDLYENGISVDLDSEEIIVKIKVICGTYDLPAKAAVLNMTQYNGSDSCITCEEPGKTVKQGKGTSRNFPYRTSEQKYPHRTHASVSDNMVNARPNGRIKGFKGVAPLSNLKAFDVVHGTPPDYMHGILLGVTKSLMYKWFSSTESKKEYFVGNKLKKISMRLNSIQPPECMERLPRDLEKNYRNFKATELQAWLLYYALPCLMGILPDKFLQHLSLLAEGLYILLGDSIMPLDLQRADNLFDMFFKQFSVLYSEGSCGLNVHNIGSHLVDYVSLLGPLWGWSCFPFEDCNSMITKAVHGTGNITKQVMKLKEAQSLLRNNLQLSSRCKMWKNVKIMSNCEVAGAIMELKKDEYTDIVLRDLNTEMSEIKKIDRIILNGRKIYSGSYSRMKRRICNTFMTKKGTAIVVKYFVLHQQSQLVFAVALPLLLSEWGIGELSAGKHLAVAQINNRCEVMLVHELKENLWFIDVHDDIVDKFVARMPNAHGHSVFK